MPHLRVILSICLLSLCAGLSSQDLCTGSLGVNIFDAGDFGSGTPNRLSTDPGIAPGYIYTRGLPDDGFYTITNDMSLWNNIFPSWLTIQDNSQDPRGYMMVVNATFSTGLFFEQDIDGLCENTFYEFSADIINLIAAGNANHIAPNVSFLLDDVVQYSSGDIPQNETWITYGFTFTTPPGQTSIKLSLQNNAPGGIGNDLALDNISFRACGPSAFISTERDQFYCEDDNTPSEIIADLDLSERIIQWQISRDEGLSWTTVTDDQVNTIIHSDFSPGSYYYRYVSATSVENLANSKCRTISEIIRITVLPRELTVRDTICTGGRYGFDGDSIGQSGSYVGEFISRRGCDSIVTLQLAVLPNDLSGSVSVESPLCPGDRNGRIVLTEIVGAVGDVQRSLSGIPFTGDSFDDLASGSYELVLIDEAGCRSMQTIRVTPASAITLEAGPLLELQLGETLSNYLASISGDVTMIDWAPPTGLSCSDCPDPEITAIGDIDYFITIRDVNGCSVSDTLLVRSTIDDIPIYLPNVFSPNGDGVNDLHRAFVTSPAIEAISNFQVYDRWGSLVYHATDVDPSDPSIGWDGTCKAQPCPVAVYTSVVELRLLTGQVLTVSGDVTLVR